MEISCFSFHFESLFCDKMTICNRFVAYSFDLYQEMVRISHFFPEKFADTVKSSYLCSVKKKMTKLSF